MATAMTSGDRALGGRDRGDDRDLADPQCRVDELEADHVARPRPGRVTQTVEGWRVTGPGLKTAIGRPDDDPDDHHPAEDDPRTGPRSGWTARSTVLR